MAEANNGHSQEEMAKLVSVLDKARGVLLKNILEKIRNGESLTAHELKLMDEYEARFAAEKAGRGRRIVGSVREVAEYLGKSARTVNYYKAQGMPVNPDGTYDLDAIDEWVEERKGKGVGQPHGKPAAGGQEASDGVTGDRNYWEAFYREFRGRREKLIYEQLKGKLIEKQSVNELLETRAFELKRALLDRDRRLAGLLAHKDEKECARILHEDSLNMLEIYSRGHTLGGVDSEEEKKEK